MGTLRRFIHPVYRMDVCADKDPTKCDIANDAVWVDYDKWLSLPGSMTEPTRQQIRKQCEDLHGNPNPARDRRGQYNAPPRKTRTRAHCRRIPGDTNTIRPPPRANEKFAEAPGFHLASGVLCWFARNMVKLDLVKMRRVLSLLVALGLAGLGPLPVSACALLHSQANECEIPQTMVDCERMGMEQAEKPPVTVSNAGQSCCAISNAPSPVAQTWAGSFAVARTPALASNIMFATPPVASTWSPGFPQTSSPRLAQSLLCTFLI